MVIWICISMFCIKSSEFSTFFYQIYCVALGLRNSFRLPRLNIGNLVDFVERERRIDLLCLRNMSDEQPSKLEANGIFDTAVNGTSDEIEMEERRSTKDTQPSVMRDREGDSNEKKLALQNSRAGYIGNLTKVHNEIVHLTESGASSEDVSKECARFDEAWRKFVDAHESYLKLLDPLTDAIVLEKTQKTYDEQLQRKLNLDFSVRLWYKDKEPERGDNYSSFRAERKGADVVEFPHGVQHCRQCLEKGGNWPWHN